MIFLFYPYNKIFYLVDWLDGSIHVYMSWRSELINKVLYVQNDMIFNWYANMVYAKTF